MANSAKGCRGHAWPLLAFFVDVTYCMSSIAMSVGFGVGVGVVELEGGLRRTRMATFESMALGWRLRLGFRSGLRFEHLLTFAYTKSTSLAPDNATAPCNE